MIVHSLFIKFCLLQSEITALLNFVRTIDVNSGVSSNAARTNAIKSLVIQTCMETFVQLYSFATNSALR